MPSSDDGGAALRFQIGQDVWQATFDAEPDYVRCPECAGTGHIRCLMPDDTMVSVDCEGCRRGYDGPQGVLQVYKRKPRASLVSIKGFEFRDGKVDWETTLSYRSKDDDLFLTEEEAKARAIFIAADFDKEERERVNKKEKDTRSWSWHVHYHRREIREAEKRIEYHKAKLAVANLKAKESKLAPESLQ